MALVIRSHDATDAKNVIEAREFENPETPSILVSIDSGKVVRSILLSMSDARDFAKCLLAMSNGKNPAQFL